MRVGVAIPCFIGHIPQCLTLLDSIENQTRKPDEVVVSCSSTTEFPTKQYSYPVRIITTEKKQNASTNRNIAASNLTTDIICFFDADDKMHPQRLEIIEHSFENTDIILHSFFEEAEKNCNYPHIDMSNYCIIRNQLSRAPSGCITLDNIQRIHHGQVSITQQIFQQVRFPEDPIYETREDCAFCYSVFELPDIRSAYLPYPLSKYIPSLTCFSEKEKI